MTNAYPQSTNPSPTFQPTATPVASTNTASSLPPKKKGLFSSFTKKTWYLIGGLVALIVLVVGSGAGLYLAGTTTENRPAASIACGTITCNDNTTFGEDGEAPHANCDLRAQEACASHGGVRSMGSAPGGGGDDDNNNNGGETPAGTCSSSAPTASACYGKAFGSRIGGTCTCTQTTGNLCACVANVGDACSSAQSVAAVSRCQDNKQQKCFPYTDGNGATAYHWQETGLSCTGGSTSGGGNTGGTGGNDNGGACITGGNSCESGSCCSGLVCQGTTGNRKCEQQDTSVCTGGGTCTGYIGFKCSSLSPSSTSNGRPVCESNPTGIVSRAAAVAHAGSCGQIDQVCENGTNNGTLCGEFTIYDDSCGGGGGSYSCNSTCTADSQCTSANANLRCLGNEGAKKCRLPSNPSSTTCQPPAPLACNSICENHAECRVANDAFRCLEANNGSMRCRLPSNPDSNTCQPPSGPQCVNIAMRKADGTAIKVGDPDPKLGDSVKFACGEVEGAAKYIFRVIEPDGTIVNLTATNRLSENYTITKSGTFKAQCQFCTGAADSTCQAYEDLN